MLKTNRKSRFFRRLLRLLQKSTVSQSCEQDCLDFAERMKRKALRVRSEGSIPPYVTKAESRKQHSDSPLYDSLLIFSLQKISRNISKNLSEHFRKTLGTFFQKTYVSFFERRKSAFLSSLGHLFSLSCKTCRTLLPERVILTWLHSSNPS